MRVLLISRAMVAASYRSRLPELARCGIHLTVVAPDRWENQKFEPGLADGYELVVKHVAIGWQALGSLAHHTFYFRDISRVIRRQDWDLIHIDDEPYNFATFHALAAYSSAKAKIVFSTWQNMVKRYPPPFNLFERRTFDRAAGAIPGNEEALAVLRRKGFSGPATVIPHHGVDVNLFSRQDASDLRGRLGLQDRFLIGYVGRIVRDKGVHALVSALAQLPPDSALAIIGSGSARPHLEQMAVDLGVAVRIRWIPWVATSELPEYMNAMDVLVLPSITTRHWKEQLGRVLIEAMACETCVVGSDSGEIPNVIGEAGLVFHEGNDRELADCLRRLMNDTTLRESLGRCGRERVLNHFSDTRVARATAAFYRLICGSESNADTDGTLQSECQPLSS